MNFLIGIDDTDNLESRGTGHCVRQLANWRTENQLATPNGITRHQLLVDPQIPYTSHNSSACLSVETENVEDVWEACREYLLRESAIGSDVGLCLCRLESVPGQVMEFGRRAKIEVLTMREAEQTASDSGIRLAGLTGTGGRRHRSAGRHRLASRRGRWTLPLAAGAARTKRGLSRLPDLFERPHRSHLYTGRDRLNF